MAAGVFDNPLLQAAPSLDPSAATLPPLTPQEEQDLLQRVAGGTLGTLHYVGASLNKAFGGRAIRGALGGHYRELASIIPFSDAAQLTDPTEEVSGEDLLKKWGIIGRGTPGQFELRDLAGPALEAALDPGTYLTMGAHALTPAGEAAKLAGTLEPSLAGRIATGQGSFARLAGVPLGAGPTALRMARYVGKGADWLGSTLPARALSAAFDPSVTMNGTTFLNGAVQDAARRFNGGLMAEDLPERLGILKQLDNLKATGQTADAKALQAVINGTASALPGNPLVEQAARAWNRGLPADLAAARSNYLQAATQLEEGGALQAPKELRAVLEGQASPLPNTPAGQSLQAAHASIQARLQQMLLEAQESGRPIQELQDRYANYAPRYRSTLAQATPGYENSAFGGAGGIPAHQGSENARIDPFRDVPGGTEGVNAILNDPSVSGPHRTLSSPAGLAEADYIRKKHLGFSAADEQQLFAWNNNPPPARLDIPDPNNPGKTISVPNSIAQEHERLKGVYRQGSDLAEIAAGLDPQYAGKKLDYFANHPLGDYLQYEMQHARAQRGTQTLYDLIGGEAVKPGANTVPITKVLDQLGLQSTLVPGGKSTGAVPQVLQAMRQAGHPASGLANWHIPGDVAGELLRYQKASTPGALKPLLNAWDSVTNMTKASMLSLLPTSWVRHGSRDALTGMFQNTVGGAVDRRFGWADPRRYLQPFLDASAARKGGAIAGANTIQGLEGLTDQAATRGLLEEMFAYDARTAPSRAEAGEMVGRPRLGEAPGMAAQGGAAASPATISLPGRTAEPSFLEMAQGGIPKKLQDVNPLNVAGVNGRVEDTNTLVKAGKEITGAVDDTNRIAAYVALRRGGYSPLEAAAKSKVLHYDYSALTPFERSVMRRFVPFYTWTRKNTPFTLKELSQNPGGLMAQSVKALGRTREGEGFVPDYIAEGTGIPLGSEGPDGTRRFLTSLGLPIEDMLGPLAPGTAKPVERTLQGIVGELNPLLKMPIELAAGKQMISGRDLNDLYGPTGNTLLDQGIMNSPLQQFYTQARTALDPRKDILARGFNLAGPGKLRDVQMPAARAVAEREAVEDLLTNNPQVKKFQDLYVPKEEMGSLSPEQLQLLRLYKTLAAERQQAAKLKPKAG